MLIPSFRFFMLGARQLSKPLVRAVVRRAQRDGAATRAVCVFLGRVSFGVTSVVEKWDSDEAREARRLQSDAKNTMNAKSEAKDNRSGGKETLAVVPRSRLLLHGAAAGKGAKALFARPVQSALAAFRAAAGAARAEEEFVAAGAEMLVEVVLFFVLAALMTVEISYAAALAAAKERDLLARIERLEAEVLKRSEENGVEAEEGEKAAEATNSEEEVSRMECIKSALGFIPRLLYKLQGENA